MLNLNQAEIDALDAGAPRLGVFFRLNVAPVVRLWLGIGACNPGITAVDPSGAVYSGFGELHGVPEFGQLLNGVADRVTFSIEGVSERAMQMAGAEAADVKGAAVLLGAGLFDPAWQVLGAPKWIRRGRADFVTAAQAMTDKGYVRRLELSVGSLFTARRRTGVLRYLTDHDQQILFPGDRFCERTALYSEAEKIWPVFPQVLIASAATASGNPTLHFASVPSAIVAGMRITNRTNPAVIPAGTTVNGAPGATTVTMSANATGAGVAQNDLIAFWTV